MATTTIWIFFIHLVCFQEIGRSFASDSCNSNAGCLFSSYCCRGYHLSSDRSCRSVASCVNRFCKSNRDCNGPRECCGRWSRCTNQCQSCQSDDDCASGERCCFSKSARRKQCSVNCPPKFCTSKQACSRENKCCRSNLCVDCSTTDCRNHGECPVGRYCCRRSSWEPGRYCGSACVGESCNVDADCAGTSECCHRKKCVKCCRSNSDCNGKYCCKGGVFEKSMCKPDGCVGQGCFIDSDCGGPSECCRNKRCVKCTGLECKTNSECGRGGYCCGSRCNTSCIGNKCTFNSDCADPVEECTYPDSDCVYRSSGKTCPENPVWKCFHSKGCTTHGDCNIFASGYSCCQGRNYVQRSCNSNCINKHCSSNDEECGSGECCDAENTCQKCPNPFPSWLIGVIVGIVVLVLAVVVWMVRCIYVRHERQRMAGQSAPQGTIAMQLRQNDDHQSVNGPTVGGFGQTQQSTEPQEEASSSQTVPQYAVPSPKNEVNRGDTSQGVPLPSPSDAPPSYEALFGNR